MVTKNRKSNRLLASVAGVMVLSTEAPIVRAPFCGLAGPAWPSPGALRSCHSSGMPSEPLPSPAAGHAGTIGAALLVLPRNALVEDVLGFGLGQRRKKKPRRADRPAPGIPC